MLKSIKSSKRLAFSKFFWSLLTSWSNFLKTFHVVAFLNFVTYLSLFEILVCTHIFMSNQWKNEKHPDKRCVKFKINGLYTTVYTKNNNSSILLSLSLFRFIVLQYLFRWFMKILFQWKRKSIITNKMYEYQQRQSSI